MCQLLKYGAKELGKVSKKCWQTLHSWLYQTAKRILKIRGSQKKNQVIWDIRNSNTRRNRKWHTKSKKNKWTRWNWRIRHHKFQDRNTGLEKVERSKMSMRFEIKPKALSWRMKGYEWMNGEKWLFKNWIFTHQLSWTLF